MTKNKEIYYLEKLIKANKMLYYKGLAITDDYEYDQWEDRLKKLDPTNRIANYAGYSDTWLGNKGYRND